MRMIAAFVLSFSASATFAATSPQAALSDLTASEHALSEAAASLTPGEGIASLLADDGLLITRQGLMRGREAAVASLTANPANRGNHASWHSIRAGVSADGLQGFTLGYLDIDGADAATAHRHYLAYWVRTQKGWRVAAMKQSLAKAGEDSASPQKPFLPLHAARANPRLVGANTRSLIAAEKGFSNRAQVVGIWQAFQENGRPDAIHLTGRNGFAIGLGAIGENQAGAPPGPSPVNWSADSAIVASSGDLGVTIGSIRQNAPKANEPASFPFFTVWARDNPRQSWRYIAE